MNKSRAFRRPSADAGFKKVVGISFLLCLLAPFFILLSFLPANIQNPVGPDFWQEFVSSLIFSSHQAFGSAAISLGLGFLGALGLISLPRRLLKYLEWFFLFPNVLPVLLVVISFMNMSQWIAKIPYGYWGIVGVHGWINVGLVSVALAKTMREKLGGLSQLALIDGVKARRFIFKVLIPVLKMDFVFIFVFIFSISFSSFAVPLILSGGRGITLEVLIYEKIRQGGLWSEALIISIVQILILLFFVTILKRERGIGEKTDQNFVGWFGHIFYLVIPALPVALILIGLVPGWQVGWEQFLSLLKLGNFFHVALAGSLLISVGSGVGTVLSLLLFSRLWPIPWLDKFLLGFLTPSSIITGFALLVFFETQNQTILFLKVIIGLSLINFPLVYKLFGASMLEQLNTQVTMARCLGAEPSMIMKKIVFPQVIKKYCWIGGLVGFWSLGEFGLLGIILRGDDTMSLLMKSFLASYRLELATFMVLPIVVVGTVVFMFFNFTGALLERRILFK